MAGGKGHGARLLDERWVRLDGEVQRLGYLEMRVRCDRDFGKESFI